MFHEEDIDQELPSETDDGEFGNIDSNTQVPGHGYSLMQAQVVYYRYEICKVSKVHIRINKRLGSIT